MGLGAGCGRELRRTELPPNIVVYLVDTLRKDHLSVYGYPRETSPRLAEFARDAVRFETAYSPTSWTKPAVASLLTGVTPLRHGAISQSDRLDPEVRLLPQYLSSAGYHSAAFVTNPHVLPVWGFSRGFDEFIDVGRAESAARADEINEAVFRHLEKDRSEPFFLYVHTVDPHQPYRAPPRFAARFPPPRHRELTSPDAEMAERARLAKVVAAYDAEVLFSDHEFGRLIQFLDAQGLYRNALVVFTADHGEELRDRGALGHGSSLFEEVVQVPLLVKLPRNAHAGRVVRAPASLLDVLPTIVRLAGGDPVGDLEGVDLLALLRAEDRGEETQARPFFLDLDLDAMSEKGARTIASGVVWKGHKLLDFHEPRGGAQLFDLVRDPGERHDVALQEPALAEHLLSTLADHRSRVEKGVHLWITNANDERTRRVEGSLRSRGRFTALRTLQLDPGDRAEITPDGRRLVVSLELRNRPNPLQEPPFVFVDQDQLVFSVEPPAAPFEIESLKIDGVAAPIFLGEDGRLASAPPLVIDPAAPELRVERMDGLIPASRGASSLGAHLGVVRRTSALGVALDPAVEERLRALGYARGGSYPQPTQVE